MPDKLEPIIHKMTEAMPEAPHDAGHGHTGPSDPASPQVDLKQHNAEVQPDRDERLVGVGRGMQTTGHVGHNRPRTFPHPRAV